MRGLPVISVRRFCNENGTRTRKRLNDSEIEKEVTKSIAQIVNVFLQNIVGGEFCSILKSFCTLSFIPKQQIPDKYFTPYLLSLSEK